MPSSYQFKDGIIVHSIASVSAGFVATSKCILFQDVTVWTNFI